MRTYTHFLINTTGRVFLLTGPGSIRAIGVRRVRPEGPLESGYWCPTAQVLSESRFDTAQDLIQAFLKANGQEGWTLEPADKPGKYAIRPPSPKVEVRFVPGSASDRAGVFRCTFCEAVRDIGLTPTGTFWSVGQQTEWPTLDQALKSIFPSLLGKRINIVNTNQENDPCDF